MDKTSCINEVWKQLSNTQFYEPTETDLTGEAIHGVDLHVHDMLPKGKILQNTCSNLTTGTDGTQQLYILPKIHKDPNNPSGRPTVSDSGGPTEKISQFVDHVIGPLVALPQSHVRDVSPLINILNELSV